jgi:hypothetical protein
MDNRTTGQTMLVEPSGKCTRSIDVEGRSGRIGSSVVDSWNSASSARTAGEHEKNLIRLCKGVRKEQTPVSDAVVGSIHLELEQQL